MIGLCLSEVITSPVNCEIRPISPTIVSSCLNEISGRFHGSSPLIYNRLLGFSEEATHELRGKLKEKKTGVTNRNKRAELRKVKRGRELLKPTDAIEGYVKRLAWMAVK